MLQIFSAIPVQNSNPFQIRAGSFNVRASAATATQIRTKPFTSVLQITSSTSESTRNHLSNLEKLLEKPSLQPIKKPDPVIKKDPAVKTLKENRGMLLLERLNLSGIWSEKKPSDEISPRHVKRLQRLLSKSIEYSPRDSLASRWREYHGCNDWAGLLDPLDDNLRREIVRFGEFIQAAYQEFNSNPATSPDEAPLPHHVTLRDKSYKVTKGLYATSSVGLPNWVDDVAPDLGWMTQRTSWVGYVAVCDDKREIARMGRRDIVIALRGTATCLEWAENFRDVLVPMADPNQDQPKVQCGFSSLFNTAGTHVPSLSESVTEEIKRLINHFKGENLSITVTGHSLGAALALLVANELATCVPDVPPVAVFSFGSPRVGNRSFANHLESNNVKVLRIVNSQDIITRVPGIFASEELDKKLRNSPAAGVLDVLDDNMPWAYSHVGTELRVDTKMSPYLKPNADVACCHDLEAYLHLVDGFVSSKCPFRTNAKRSLWKLVNEQSSNVKQLYTNKDKGLRLNLERQRFESIPPSSS